MQILEKHKILEKNATLLLIFSFIVVTIGGLVQITPCSIWKTPSRRWKGSAPTPHWN